MEFLYILDTKASEVEGLWPLALQGGPLPLSCRPIPSSEPTPRSEVTLPEPKMDQVSDSKCVRLTTQVGGQRPPVALLTQLDSRMSQCPHWDRRNY